MTSYLRNLFGIQSNPSSSSSTSSHGMPRSSRSSYTPSPTSSISSSASRSGSISYKRTNSYSAAQSTSPSPLRGVAYESSNTHLPKRTASKSHSKSNSIPVYYQVPQHDTGHTGPHYHIRAPAAPYMVTPNSSRTGSSASLHSGTPAMAYMRPLSRSTSHSIRSKPSRPALKQNHTWQSNGTASSTGHTSSHARSHVTFQSPSSLHMHPLFAYSRLHHAPIAYNVIHTPSAQTVLDCTTRSPVPAHTLAQPATDPPTAAPSQLVLRSHKFPWTIVVNSSGPASSSGSSRKMSRSHSRSSSMQGGVITNLDVLHAVHKTLSVRVTPEEWEALGNGSKAQRKVTKAYEKRCTLQGGWEGGVRRVDWLGGKTHLSGIEVDKSNGNSVGKLIFSKA